MRRGAARPDYPPQHAPATRTTRTRIPAATRAAVVDYPPATRAATCTATALPGRTTAATCPATRTTRTTGYPPRRAPLQQRPDTATAVRLTRDATTRYDAHATSNKRYPARYQGGHEDTMIETLIAIFKVAFLSTEDVRNERPQVCELLTECYDALVHIHKKNNLDRFRVLSYFIRPIWIHKVNRYSDSDYSGSLDAATFDIFSTFVRLYQWTNYVHDEDKLTKRELDIVHNLLKAACAQATDPRTA